MLYMMYDRVEIDDAAQVRKLADGRIVARPRVARTGIQLYRGSEVGLPDKELVRVYRSPEEVFHPDAMSSFLHVPVTNDHPPESVTPQNFTKYAKGWTGDEAVRDGKALRVPMMLADASLIAAYEGGKNQLSNGYVCSVDWTPGTDPDTGEAYDGAQKNIRGNHVAVVKAARGGADLRIGDAMQMGSTTCPECGASVPDGAKYCPNCGHEMGMTGDRDYTAEQRKAMAQSGEALPDGSYPIKNKSDLSNAIQAYGRNPTSRVKNHIIKRARALGATSSLPEGWADAASADDAAATRDRVGYNGETNMTVKNLTVDGVSLEFSDVAASVVLRAMETRDRQVSELTAKLEAVDKAARAAKDAADAAAATAATTISARDEEIAKLKKAVADSEVTPQRLDQMVAERQAVITVAGAILGDRLVVKDKTIGDIKRQVVDAKLGDKAKGWNEVKIDASFESISATIDTQAVLAADGSGHRPGHGGPTVYDVARTFGGAGSAQPGAVDKAYQDHDKALTEQWRKPFAAA